MNPIVLKKNGLIGEAGKEQGLTQDVLMHLSSRIALEEDCTLRSFFRMFETYPDLARLSAFSGSFIEQVRAAGEGPGRCDDFHCLELSKVVEMTGYPGKPGMNIYLSLKGLTGRESRELKFYHLENLLNIPLRLGMLKHVIFGDCSNMFEFETFFTLFELIDGISWELSFNFNPLQCDIRR